jgi:hypothetical protein
MELDEAELYLRHCSDASGAMARKAVRNSVAEISDYEVKGASVLLASGRPLPGLAAILASHATIHTAEGEFYRAALREACACCGLREIGIKERDLMAEAIHTLGRSAENLERSIAEFGRVVGSPWRQDEKLSALAAWLALNQCATQPCTLPQFD